MARIFIFVSITLILSSCSLSTDNDHNQKATLHFNFVGSEEPMTQSLVSAMDFSKYAFSSTPPSSTSVFKCYGVNVVGNGIASSDSFDSNLGEILSGLYKGESCSYPGVISSPIKPQDNISVKLQVPTGSKRIIQVIGFDDPSSVVCNSSSFLDKTKNNTSVRAYEVGRAQLDIYTDTSVSISNSYDSLTTDAEKTAKDVMCGTGGGGGNLPSDLTIYLSGPSSTPLAACSTGYVSISLQQNNANYIPSEDVSITVSSSNGGVYSDSSCGTPINSITLGPNTSTSSFYMKAATAATVVITASPPSTYSTWTSGSHSASVVVY